MDQIIEVDIIGSCVTRDSFEMASDRYKVKHYVSRNSLFAACTEPLPLKSDEFDVKHEYLRRMICCDFNKNYISDFKNNTAKYLVLDLIDERFQLLKFEDYPNSIITYSSNLRNSDILINHEKYSKLKYTLFESDEYDIEYQRQCVKKYIDSLTQLYPIENIYLNRSVLVGHYYNKYGKLCSFPASRINEYKQINIRLQRLYSLMMEYIKPENVIEMPNPCYADESQKWGLAPFHYFDIYYKAFVNNFSEKIKGREKM